MDQLSNFISEYLKTCETIKKLNSKTIKAYRIDLSQFLTEYSCAVTPQVRQTGNRLSGLAGTAYASLLT